MTIRVLVVDDSPTMRALLTQILRREPDLEVVGTACDAAQARTMIRALDPDVVTLDLEMPEMHGLDFLARLMRLRPTPVIVVSGLTRDGADATAHALAIGAVDCYAKPSGRAGDLLLSDHGRLAELIRAAARVRSRALAPGIGRLEAIRAGADGPKLIAIGASTGGVEALHVLLAGMPADCPPVLVVQHINGRFAEAVARRLDDICHPRVLLAESDQLLRSGHIYFAPGNDRHLQVAGSETLVAKLRSGEPECGHRPSIDVLFRSVARHVGDKAVGVLLTGMGCDGAQGMLAMRRAGAFTIAQDEATSVVWGMPRAAIALDAAAQIAGLDRIAGLALTRAA